MTEEAIILKPLFFHNRPHDGEQCAYISYNNDFCIKCGWQSQQHIEASHCQTEHHITRGDN